MDHWTRPDVGSTSLSRCRRPVTVRTGRRWDSSSCRPCRVRTPCLVEGTGVTRTGCHFGINLTSLRMSFCSPCRTAWFCFCRSSSNSTTLPTLTRLFGSSPHPPTTPVGTDYPVGTPRHETTDSYRPRVSCTLLLLFCPKPQRSCHNFLLHWSVWSSLYNGSYSVGGPIPLFVVKQDRVEDSS